MSCSCYKTVKWARASFEQTPSFQQEEEVKHVELSPSCSPCSSHSYLLPSIPGSSGHGRNHCRLKMCQWKVGDNRNAGALQCGLQLEGGLLFAPSGWGHFFQMHRGHCASEPHAAHQSWHHCPPPVLHSCRNVKCTPRPFSLSLDFVSLYLIYYLYIISYL